MRKLPLGPHFLNEGFDTMSDMLNRVLMRTVKFAEMDLDWLRDPNKIDLLDLASAKGCLIVGRRTSWNPDLDAPDMILEARRWYAGDRERPSFRQLAQAFPQVNVWEGPNEIAVTDTERMRKYATFLCEFARLVYEDANRIAGLGAWSVGTPDLALWRYWGPVLAATKMYSAVLTRHSYGPLDEWFALRHRQDEIEFRKFGFTNTPLLITECGTDNLPNADTCNKPWRKIWGWEDSAIDRYWGEYLKPLAEALAQDSAYVIGAHVFTVGNGGSSTWNDFDLAHTDLVGAIIRNPPALPTPGPAPEPVPSWATHCIVNCSMLNVRLFPWVGAVEPPIIGQFPAGKYVRSYCIDAGPGMEFGWHRVGADGNMWCNGRYLKAL